MKKIIGTIGHIDHSKTTLTAAIASVLASKDVQHNQKTIHEIIEEEKSIRIEKLPKVNLTCVASDGNRNRRERRANERQLKKRKK